MLDLIRKKIKYFVFTLVIYLNLCFVLSLTACVKPSNIPIEISSVTFLFVETGLALGNTVTLVGNSNPQFSLTHKNTSANPVETNATYTYAASLVVGSVYTLTLQAPTGPKSQICGFSYPGGAYFLSVTGVVNNSGITTLNIVCKDLVSAGGTMTNWPSSAGNVNFVFTPQSTGLSAGLGFYGLYAAAHDSGFISDSLSASVAAPVSCISSGQQFSCGSSLIIGETYIGTVANPPVGYYCPAYSFTASASNNAISIVCLEKPISVQVSVNGGVGPVYVLSFTDSLSHVVTYQTTTTPPCTSVAPCLQAGTYLSPDLTNGGVNPLTTGYSVSFSGPPGYTCNFTNSNQGVIIGNTSLHFNSITGGTAVLVDVTCSGIWNQGVYALSRPGHPCTTPALPALGGHDFRLVTVSSQDAVELAGTTIFGQSVASSSALFYVLNQTTDSLFPYEAPGCVVYTVGTSSETLKLTSPHLNLQGAIVSVVSNDSIPIALNGVAYDETGCPTFAAVVASTTFTEYIPQPIVFGGPGTLPLIVTYSASCPDINNGVENRNNPVTIVFNVSGTPRSNGLGQVGFTGIQIIDGQYQGDTCTLEIMPGGGVQTFSGCSSSVRNLVCIPNSVGSTTGTCQTLCGSANLPGSYSPPVADCTLLRVSSSSSKSAAQLTCQDDHILGGVTGGSVEIFTCQ